MQTHTDKHTEAKRHTVTKFQYKYAKEITGSSLEMLPGIISVVEQLKYIPNLLNKCSRKNYSQLANICHIKVKQESELIMLDYTYIYIIY
jgi:hypothetical protein